MDELEYTGTTPEPLPPEPAAPPDPAEENRWVMRNLRRRYSRIGRAFLAFLVVLQGVGTLIYFIPGIEAHPLLEELAVYVLGYGPAILVLWLILRKLPKGTSPGMRMSVPVFLRTAVVSIGLIYLFGEATDYIISALEWITGLPTGDLLQSAADSMPGWVFEITSDICAPVVEELIFRKILLDRLRPFGDMPAILISGLAFGLFHMNLYQFFYAAALGILFAGVVLKTGKIWHSMLLHAIVNSGTSLIGYLAGLGDIWETAMTVLYWVLIAAAALLVLRHCRSYRFAPPQYPATNRQAMVAIVQSVGMWVAFVITFAISVWIIFYV